MIIGIMLRGSLPNAGAFHWFWVIYRLKNQCHYISSNAGKKFNATSQSDGPQRAFSKLSMFVRLMIENIITHSNKLGNGSYLYALDTARLVQHPHQGFVQTQEIVPLVTCVALHHSCRALCGSTHLTLYRRTSVQCVFLLVSRMNGGNEPHSYHPPPAAPLHLAWSPHGAIPCGTFSSPRLDLASCPCGVLFSPTKGLHPIAVVSLCATSSLWAFAELLGNIFS